MVEQIKAWRDSTGKMHPSRAEAEMAEAMVQLQNCGLNAAGAQNLIKNARKVVDALTPFVGAVSEAARG